MSTSPEASTQINIPDHWIGGRGKSNPKIDVVGDEDVSSGGAGRGRYITKRSGRAPDKPSEVGNNTTNNAQPSNTPSGVNPSATENGAKVNPPHVERREHHQQRSKRPSGQHSGSGSGRKSRRSHGTHAADGALQEPPQESDSSESKTAPPSGASSRAGSGVKLAPTSAPGSRSASTVKEGRSSRKRPSKKLQPASQRQSNQQQIHQQEGLKPTIPLVGRQRWSSSAQFASPLDRSPGKRLETLGEGGDPSSYDSGEMDELGPLPNPGFGGSRDDSPIQYGRNISRKTSAPPAPHRAWVTPIYAPERFGMAAAAGYPGLPVVYVPFPVPPGAQVPTVKNVEVDSDTPGSHSSSASHSPRSPKSPARPQCKFWKLGKCKFGDGCIFSHAGETPAAAILPSIMAFGANWRNRIPPLSQEDTLASLRLLAHIEEVQATNLDAVMHIGTNNNVSVTELYYRLEARDTEPPAPLIVTLNEILGHSNDEILSITECASRIVPAIPEGTLDLEAILNTSRLVDNDALLFFCILLKDVQEHFYHQFKSKYLVTTPDGAYNTDGIGKILEQLGMTEREIMTKFNLSEAKKAIQASKRWRSLFILNDPTLISFGNRHVDPNTAEDLKWQILRRLDEHVRAFIRAKSEGGMVTSTPVQPPLPAFEVLNFDEPRGQSARKKLWNEYALNLTPVALYQDLTTHVAELTVPGLTNFPAIFNVLREKLKIKRLPDGQKNLDGKLGAITKMLELWPEVLLLPEVLQREDGKLHVYRSVTSQHQFGSVYLEMMTRLKKKYLYKAALGKLN